MAEGELQIEIATVVDPEFLAAVDRLLPQLSERSPTDDALLSEVIASPATTLFLARLKGEIVGMCTIAIFSIPTGVRAWIEDVVVDANARGAGVATALVNASLGHARGAGAKSVDLTSRPSREAANRLYVGMGFERRETNVYRFSLET